MGQSHWLSPEGVAFLRDEGGPSRGRQPRRDSVRATGRRSVASGKGTTSRLGAKDSPPPGLPTKNKKGPHGDGGLPGSAAPTTSSVPPTTGNCHPPAPS